MKNLHFSEKYLEMAPTSKTMKSIFSAIKLIKSQLSITWQKKKK